MEKETTRVEAFSDGVFAIAVTLLILEIRVPELEGAASGHELLASLLALWPSFVAFLLSFFVILVMWMNHHELVRWRRDVDYPFLFANGFVLLVVSFVPFPTAVLARYLGTDGDRVAAAFYCATFLVVNLSYNVLLAAVTHPVRAAPPDVPPDVLARVRRAYGASLFVYGASIALALWNAAAGLALCLSLWLVWTRLCYRVDEDSP